MGKAPQNVLDIIRHYSALGGYVFNSDHAKKLIDHIDALEAENARLIDNVANLHRRLTEANEAREAKKVVLPREVAEALRHAIPEEPGIDLDYFIWNIIRYDQFKRLDEKTNLSILFDHANSAENGVTDLVYAVRYGYTVEDQPTTEDKIKAKLEHQLFRCNVTSPTPPAELARLLTLAVREVLAEDRVEETID